MVSQSGGGLSDFFELMLLRLLYVVMQCITDCNLARTIRKHFQFYGESSLSPILKLCALAKKHELYTT